MDKITTTYIKVAPETEAVQLTEENIFDVLTWAKTIQADCWIDTDVELNPRINIPENLGKRVCPIGWFIVVWEVGGIIDRRKTLYGFSPSEFLRNWSEKIKQ